MATIFKEYSPSTDASICIDHFEEKYIYRHPKELDLIPLHISSLLFILLQPIKVKQLFLNLFESPLLKESSIQMNCPYFLIRSLLDLSKKCYHNYTVLKNIEGSPLLLLKSLYQHTFSILTLISQLLKNVFILTVIFMSSRVTKGFRSHSQRINASNLEAAFVFIIGTS